MVWDARGVAAPTPAGAVGRRRRGWPSTLLLSCLVIACHRRCPQPDALRAARSSQAEEPAPAPGGGERLFPPCRLSPELPCDVREARCQADLFSALACLSRASGAARPPVRFVSEAEARSPSTRLVPERLQWAAQRLGLGDRDDPARQPSAGVGPNAYYAPHERVVFFVAREAIPPDGPLAAFVLGHEYVHAIQDTRHTLRDVLDSRDRRTFDEELALWGAVEGEATLHEEGLRALVYGRAPRRTLAARFAALTTDIDDAIARQRRPLEASFATFPYSYGAHWALATTNAAAPPLRLAAPSSSRELMAERHGWPPLEGQGCADAGPAKLGPGWNRRAHDTLGAWIVQTYVRKRVRDPERARAAARDWRGDSLSVYDRPAERRKGRPAAGGLLWRTCWASAAVAAEMRGLIEDQLRDAPTGTSAVESRGSEVAAVALNDATLSPAAILRQLADVRPNDRRTDTGCPNSARAATTVHVSADPAASACGTSVARQAPGGWP
jgi:hypothetical protein